MRCKLLWLVLLLMPFRVLADTEVLQLTVVRADTMVASLSWSGAPEGVQYSIYRQFPGEADMNLIATTYATNYRDTIRRIVCSDTVFYKVEATAGEVSYASLKEGDFFDDQRPTTGCTLKVATIKDSKIVLSWNPSPDSDIMGYYICSGMPCLDYDTVWGRENTHYVCQDYVPTDFHSFRILAFDSCFKASPLTEPFNNIVLQVQGGACTRHITASWNGYQNMPDGLAGYELLYSNDGQDTAFRSIAEISASGALSYGWDVPDSVFHFRLKIVATNTLQTLHSVSNIVHVDIIIADTAEFLEIVESVRNTEAGCVDLSMHVDATFEASSYRLYRSRDGRNWELITELPYTGLEYIDYSDCDIAITDTCFYYRLSAFDGCGLYEKFSAQAKVAFPMMDESTLYVPNVFRPGDPENGVFCPRGTYLDLAPYEMSIYNRMGLLVYRTTTLGDCWDGTSHGVPVPQGAYVYYIHCKQNTNREKTFVGTVLLLR